MASITDSYQRMNHLRTVMGINNANADVIGSYKQAKHVSKTIIRFDIHVKNDLMPFIHGEMDIEKLWTSWKNFKEKAFGLNLKDKMSEEVMTAYVEKGVQGVVDVVYNKYRANRKKGCDQ